MFPGECIDYTRHMGFDPGNVFKYLWRWNRKEIPLQDLNKSLWYLDDVLAHSGELTTLPEGSALGVRSIPPHLVERLRTAQEEYAARPVSERGDDPVTVEREEVVARIQVDIASGAYSTARDMLVRFIDDYEAGLSS